MGRGVPVLSRCHGTHGTLVAAAAGVQEFYLENFVLELLWVMNPGLWGDGCQPDLGATGCGRSASMGKALSHSAGCEWCMVPSVCAARSSPSW